MSKYNVNKQYNQGKTKIYQCLRDVSKIKETMQNSNYKMIKIIGSMQKLSC